MVLIARKKDPPTWLESTRQFCKQNHISISAWGADLLVVEAKSPQRAQEIASQLAQLGFKVVPNDDDAYAGLLSLSQNPVFVLSKIAEL